MDVLDSITSQEPIYEDEHLRTWSEDQLSEKDKKRLEKKISKMPMIKIGNNEIYPVGFKWVMKKDEPLFLYKFKHEDQSIVYYAPDENNRVARFLLKRFGEFASEHKYEMIDLEKLSNDNADEKGARGRGKPSILAAIWAKITKKP